MRLITGHCFGCFLAGDVLDDILHRCPPGLLALWEENDDVITSLTFEIGNARK